MKFKKGDRVTTKERTGCGKCIRCILWKQGGTVKKTTGYFGSIDVAFDTPEGSSTHCTGFKPKHLRFFEINNWREALR